MKSPQAPGGFSAAGQGAGLGSVLWSAGQPERLQRAWKEALHGTSDIGVLHRLGEGGLLRMVPASLDGRRHKEQDKTDVRREVRWSI